MEDILGRVYMYLVAGDVARVGIVFDHCEIY